MLQSESASVIKRGETCIETTLHRSFHGLIISVKAHPGIEDFMRNQGNGEKVAVGSVARYWYNPENREKTIYAYLYTPIEAIRSDDGTIIDLESLGAANLFKSDERTGYNTINLSFLRLVGISEGAGVSFGVSGVFSDKYVRNLRDKIGLAQKRFYIEYLRPIRLSVSITTADMVV